MDGDGQRGESGGLAGMRKQEEARENGRRWADDRGRRKYP